MDDYISREAALNAMLEFAEFYSCEIHNAEECVIEYMNAIPAADVKPVVRCRECKHWDTGNITGRFPDGVKCYCVKLSGGLKNRFTAPDDFCCWGERKEATTDDQSAAPGRSLSPSR